MGADGAAWIWNLADDLFPSSTQMVDGYHATQHLAEAAQARFPTDVEAAQRWTNHLNDLLIKDEVWKIIAALHEAGLSHHAAYFEEHRYRL